MLLTELRGTQNYYAVKVSDMGMGGQNHDHLQALKKDAVLEDDDIECTMIERKVLALGVKHPFLCHLFCTFQTDVGVFLLLLLSLPAAVPPLLCDGISQRRRPHVPHPAAGQVRSKPILVTPTAVLPLLEGAPSPLPP